MNKIIYLFFLLSFGVGTAYTLEAINSYEHELTILSLLEGDYSANKYNFFSLSESNNKSQSFKLNILDTIFLTSVSTGYAEPELSDGSFWQGRGVNGFLSAGFNINTKYFSLTVYPEVWYAQNLFYDILPPHPSQPDQTWGYIFYGIDLPQRMGEEPILKLDWGQSEFRFDSGYFSLAFTHENFVVGPSVVNNLIMGNSAPGFWHIDLSINDIQTQIGLLKLRGFWGQLSESDFFDSNPNNNYTFISGLMTSFNPSFFPYFSLGLNRILTSNWNELDTSTFFKLYNPNFFDHGYGSDNDDQKASLTFNYSFPERQFRIYGELFFEDYSTNLNIFALIPAHATAMTTGLQQIFHPYGRKILLTVEYSQLQQSRDYEINLGVGGTYYTHGYVYHGYTNKGQILGAGIGPGSDSETIIIDWYNENSKFGIKYQRIAWQKDYIYMIQSPGNVTRLQMENILGFEYICKLSNWEIRTQFQLSVFNNRNYIRDTWMLNFYGNIGVVYHY